MVNANCTLEGFGEVLGRMVESHVREQCKMSEALVKKAARKTVDELKNGALTPANTGEYADGWGQTTVRDSDDWCEIVVHNKKRWQLTHLLEKGHAKFLWGIPTGERVPAYPHILPAFVVGSEILRNATVSN